MLNFSSAKYVEKLAVIVAAIDKVTLVMGKLLAWFTLLMVLLTFLIVVLRYGFNIGWIAMQESVLFFHAMVFMLGAAYTLQKDAHVRVDIFYQKFSPRTKAIVNLCGALFLLIPVCVFIIIISNSYVLSSWSILEKSSEAGGLPTVYLSKSFILVFAFFMLLQAVAEIGRSLLTILKPIVSLHANHSSEKL